MNGAPLSWPSGWRRDVRGSGSERASYYGRTVDALASGADEGRGIAAISPGERPITRDHPGIPEWGNPPGSPGTRLRAGGKWGN